jgi:hypothetical protein
MNRGFALSLAEMSVPIKLGCYRNASADRSLAAARIASETRAP